MSVKQDSSNLPSSNPNLDKYDDNKFWFHGTAIGEGDVTRGKSNIIKKWPKKTLKQAASSLKGKPIVDEHQNNTSSIIGKVTDSSYKDGVGVKYKGFVRSAELALNIKDDLIDVSPRIVHKPVSQLSKNDKGAIMMEGASFDNLSTTIKGAAKSNTAVYGNVESLSASELSEAFEGIINDEQAEELAFNGTTNSIVDIDTGEFAYVSLREHKTDGRYLKFNESFVASSPYAVGVHLAGGSPDSNDVNLGKNIGMSQWYPAGQVITNTRIWLTDNIQSSQLMYVAIYHENEDGNKDILRYNDQKVYDSSYVEVDDDAFYGLTKPDPKYLPYGKEELASDFGIEVSSELSLPSSNDIEELEESDDERNDSLEEDELSDKTNYSFVKTR